jgi:hypothetical protein
LQEYKLKQHNWDQKFNSNYFKNDKNTLKNKLSYNILIEDNKELNNANKELTIFDTSNNDIWINNSLSELTKQTLLNNIISNNIITSESKSPKNNISDINMSENITENKMVEVSSDDKNITEEINNITEEINNITLDKISTEENKNITTENKIAEVTTENKIAEVTTENKIAEVTTENKIAEITTENKIAEITTENKIAEVTTENKIAEVTTENKIAEITSKNFTYDKILSLEKTISNLKVLMDIKSGDKLAYYDDQLYVDYKYGSFIIRWYYGVSRYSLIPYINNIINNGIFHYNEIKYNKYDNSDLHEFEVLNFKLLLLGSKKGLNNMKDTYSKDTEYIEAIDKIITTIRNITY